MFKEQLLMILMVNVHSSSGAIDAIYDIGKKVWKLYTIIDNMELNISRDAKSGETFSQSNTIIDEMGDEMDDIHEQLRQLEQYMNSKKIQDAVKSLPFDAITRMNIDRMDIFIERIDEYYKNFHQYRNKENYYFCPTFQNFIQETFLEVEPNIGIIRRIMLQDESSGTNFENFPSAIAASTAIHQVQIGDDTQMISNILMQLFRIVMIAEMKANMMLTFANIHRYILDEKKKTCRRVNALAREQFEKQIGSYLSLFSSIFILVDRIYLRASDPDDNKWIRGDTLYELDKTFDTSLVRYHWFNCKYDSCNDIIIHKSYQCKPIFYDNRSSCTGNMASCAYLGAIQACVLKAGSRKFEYVNSTELGRLGKNSKCPTDIGYIINDGTGWNISFASCVCNCYSSQNKISLSIVESDVRSNHVITGLRFVRMNQVLAIQPRTALLSANGYINPRSQRWISILKIIPPSAAHHIDSNNKVFFLDDVRLPPSCVLTGVKFNRVTRGNITGFAIEIFGRKFDYRSGKLDRNEESRISRKASDTNSGKGLSFRAVSSIYTSSPHRVTPSDIKYVSLKQSRLAEDFGQSTLPQFHGVPISTHIPSPLDGIGIFHKGVRGYAGFISLRVYGLQLGKYFSDFEAAHMIDRRVIFNDSYCP